MQTCDVLNVNEAIEDELLSVYLMKPESRATGLTQAPSALGSGTSPSRFTTQGAVSSSGATM